MYRIALALSSCALAGGFYVLAAGAVAGCTTTQEAVPPALTRAELPRGCALGVPGAHVIAEDTSDGIALELVSSEHPEEMRSRARDAAVQWGPGAKLGQGHDGKHGEGGRHGLQMLQAPPAYSAATNIEGGARIIFVAVDRADTEVLRAKLHARAAEMNAATCK